MNKLQRILTAVDFSAPARSAFDHALAISRAHQAELIVVHAVPTERQFDWEALERIALTAELRHKAAAAGVDLKVSVQHGDPAQVILLHARARRPQLIVMGTHRRLGFDRIRFGSVAEAVVLRARQPVLVVPQSEAGGSIGPTFDRIVVGVDFSPGSSAVVDSALLMANANSRVTLVHVIAGVHHATARYKYRVLDREYQRWLAGDAWQRMPDIVPADAQATVQTRVVTGDPAGEIARVAGEADADLILVGVTRRGAIGRRLFGSTAARVIRAAGRPVLALPAPLGERSGQPIEADRRIAA